jgi:hypothetical protein
MIEDFTTWLAADPHNPVIAIGVLLILALLAYGIAKEARWERRAEVEVEEQPRPTVAEQMDQLTAAVDETRQAIAEALNPTLVRMVEALNDACEVIEQRKQGQ